MTDLFDHRARQQRRERAARAGFATFLHERAFDDLLDRLAMVTRRFDRALLIGCPDAGWPARLARHAASVDVIEPAPTLARAVNAQAHGARDESALLDAPAQGYDLIVAAGTLHQLGALPAILVAANRALSPDGLLIGALPGGDSLPALRAALLEADRAGGQGHAPRVHPRIGATSLAELLTRSGFVMPVVDVDRVTLSYRTLDALVADLRATGETNLLAQRSRRPLTRAWRDAAADAFQSRADADGRVNEQVEILHFAAWTPPPPLIPLLNEK